MSLFSQGFIIQPASRSSVDTTTTVPALSTNARESDGGNEAMPAQSLTLFALG